MRQNSVDFLRCQRCAAMYNATSSQGEHHEEHEQAPSKRVRIVLCAAAFTFAAAVPGAGLAADWTSAKAKPTADWTSGQAHSASSDRRLDVRQDQARRRLDVEGEDDADWTSARIKPSADWTSRVKPNADWSS